MVISVVPTTDGAASMVDNTTLFHKEPETAENSQESTAVNDAQHLYNFHLHWVLLRGNLTFFFSKENQQNYHTIFLFNCPSAYPSVS